MQTAELRRRLAQLGGPEPDISVADVRSQARRIDGRRRRRTVGAAVTVLAVGALGLTAIVARTPLPPSSQPLDGVTVPQARVDPDGAAFEALRAGDLTGLRGALSSGAAPDARTIDGLTLLMIAAYRGDRAAAEFLVDAGADVDSSSIGGATALGIAAQYGNVDVVEFLVARGADPTPSATTPWSPAPLHLATVAGRTDVIELLVEAGADPNAVTAAGRPMLLCALDAPNAAEVVDVLLRLGASIREPQTGVELALDEVSTAERLDILAALDRAGPP